MGNKFWWWQGLQGAAKTLQQLDQEALGLPNQLFMTNAHLYNVRNQFWRWQGLQGAAKSLKSTEISKFTSLQRYPPPAATGPGMT